MSSGRTSITSSWQLKCQEHGINISCLLTQSNTSAVSLRRNSASEEGDTRSFIDTASNNVSILTARFHRSPTRGERSGGPFDIASVFHIDHVPIDESPADKRTEPSSRRPSRMAGRLSVGAFPIAHSQSWHRKIPASN